jgi:hypothetical protein
MENITRLSIFVMLIASAACYSIRDYQHDEAYDYDQDIASLDLYVNDEGNHFKTRSDLLQMFKEKGIDQNTVQRIQQKPANIQLSKIFDSDHDADDGFWMKVLRYGKYLIHFIQMFM